MTQWPNQDIQRAQQTAPLMSGFRKYPEEGTPQGGVISPLLSNIYLHEVLEPWDSLCAHKPWVIKHEGVVYHFHNAVGKEGRVIALATSKDLRNKSK